ncbi:MAG: hypothetical protein V6Z86_01155 [Hyphomicrobiales bacterium]
MPNSKFYSKGCLPLKGVMFKHDCLPEQADSPARICHCVAMTGPLAPVFARLIGKRVKADTKDAVETLSARVSSVGQPC